MTKFALLGSALAAVSLIGASVRARGAQSSAAADSGVIYLDHTKVDAAFAKGGGLIPGDGRNFTVMAGRHDTPGGAEVHTNDTDIFYILDGAATFLTGGTVVDSKQTSPTEIRGKALEGAAMHNLVKGDVIVIPKGVPHWFKEVTSKPVLYFVVKVR